MVQVRLVLVSPLPIFFSSIKCEGVGYKFHFIYIFFLRGGGGSEIISIRTGEMDFVLYTPASPLRDGGSPESSSSRPGFYITLYLAQDLMDILYYVSICGIMSYTFTYICLNNRRICVEYISATKL